MARLSQEEVKEIIERDLPSFQVAQEPPVDEDVEDSADISGSRDSFSKGSDSDATSPDLDTLLQKLRSRNRTGESERSRGFDSVTSGISEVDEGNDDADDVIVPVRPKKSHSAYDVGYRTKAVVISGRSKKVIGRQG
jgi:hypothetical protein